MNIAKVSSVFFSATGRAEKVLDGFLGGLPVPAHKINITSYLDAELTENFSSQDLVVFASSVYGGRLPAPAVERFSQMRGHQTPAVGLVVFGNRHFDDALLEMKNVLLKAGFLPVAFVAAVAEHSLFPAVAKGRPDEQDQKKLADFAFRVWEKLGDTAQVSREDVPDVTGHFPYRKFSGLHLKLKVAAECAKCAICAQHCPTGAICPQTPNETDFARCIDCMGCAVVCPLQGRVIDGGWRWWLAKKLFPFLCRRRREAQFFIKE